MTWQDDLEHADEVLCCYGAIRTSLYDVVDVRHSNLAADGDYFPVIEALIARAWKLA